MSGTLVAPAPNIDVLPAPDAGNGGLETMLLIPSPQEFWAQERSSCIEIEFATIKESVVTRRQKLDKSTADGPAAVEEAPADSTVRALREVGLRIAQDAKANLRDDAQEGLSWAEKELEFARNAYAEEIVATRGHTFHDIFGDSTLRVGKEKQQYRLAEENVQFRYEVAAGVAEKFVRERAAKEAADEDQATQELRQKESGLAYLLGIEDDAGTVGEGELFKLNKLVWQKELLRTGQYEAVMDYSGDKTTIVDVVEKTDNNYLRQKLINFTRRWHRWSQEGKKGVAKKVGMGLVLTAGSAALGAIGAGTGLVGFGGAVISGGMALRVSRTAAMQKLGRRDGQLQAIDDAERREDAYADEVAAKSEAIRTGADEFGIDDFSGKISRDFTAEALRRAKANRIGALVTMVSLGSAMGLGDLVGGYLTHHIGTGHTGHAAGKPPIHSTPRVAQTPAHQTAPSITTHPSPAPQPTHPALKLPAHKPIVANGADAHVTAHSGFESQAAHHRYGSHLPTDKPVPHHVIPRANLGHARVPVIHTTGINRQTVSGVYEHAFGLHKGFNEMVQRAHAAIAHHELIRVQPDPSDPENSWYTLTEKGAKAIGKKSAAGSSRTADVVRLLAKGGKVKLAA